MYQTLKSFLCASRFSAGLFVLFFLPLNANAVIAGDIVVTIKPLYSLVAQLSEGVQKPVLLMKQMPSPHHYTMRPSDRRLLANAGMIVWIGPQMESYLEKIIRQQDAIIVSAIQADGIKLLERRIKNDSHHASEHATHDHLDPHIWLSSHNALAISKHIAQQLINNDPDNTARYEKNLQRLSNRISQLAAEIKTSLQNHPQPFITYHDAFQYFEQENQLHYVDSISFDEEAGTSLKHLRRIKSEIEKQHIQCLLYQAPEPDIIRTLTANTKIRAVAQDPLGLHVQNEKNAWFEIMRNMGVNFKRCLNTD